MHIQLHHDSAGVNEAIDILNGKPTENKVNTLPRTFTAHSYAENKGIPLIGRTSSATRLFDKLRSKICRSKTLLSHPEEMDSSNLNTFAVVPECTSQSAKVEVSHNIQRSGLKENETFSCHLCSFDADRITVLDRHLLNDHKIGLDNLLKLVMAKTKDGLSEDAGGIHFGIRQPYYRPPDDIIEEGEFVIETVTPKIKILKHASTNTEISMMNTPNLKDNCTMLTRELENFMQNPINCNRDELMLKMKTLDECMCKFVDSSNTLKKILKKELDSKHSAREESINYDTPHFDLGLGDQETPRDWAFQELNSDKMNRSRYQDY